MKQELGPLQKKWMEALRAHPERQMKSFLGRRKENGDYGACCLGEGGLVAGVCEWRGDTLIVKGSAVDTLLYGVHKSLGLRDDIGAAASTDAHPLAYLNDNGKTWPEIADIIEADPSVYFTHPV